MSQEEKGGTEMRKLSKSPRSNRTVPETQTEVLDVNLGEVPLDYMMRANDESLRGFETAQLNIAANMDKQITQIARERDRAKLTADLCRFLIDHRDELLMRLGDHVKLAERQGSRRLKE
jgi:hypothetical protein